MKRQIRAASVGGGGGATMVNYVQNRFEQRIVTSTNSDFGEIEGDGIARSPRLWRGSLCFQPCNSELNPRADEEKNGFIC